MILNRLLVGALFNKKEPQVEGDCHPRSDTLQRLLGKLQLWTRVIRPTETVRFSNHNQVSLGWVSRT